MFFFFILYHSLQLKKIKYTRIIFSRLEYLLIIIENELRYFCYMSIFASYYNYLQFGGKDSKNVTKI